MLTAGPRHQTPERNLIGRLVPGIARVVYYLCCLIPCSLLFSISVDIHLIRCVFDVPIKVVFSSSRISQMPSRWGCAGAGAPIASHRRVRRLRLWGRLPKIWLRGHSRILQRLRARLFYFPVWYDFDIRILFVYLLGRRVWKIRDFFRSEQSKQPGLERCHRKDQELGGHRGWVTMHIHNVNFTCIDTSYLPWNQGNGPLGWL